MDFIKDKILKIKEYDLNLDTEGEEVLVEKETDEEKPLEESGEKEIPVNEVLEEDGDGDLEDDASEESEEEENKEEPKKDETPEENQEENSEDDSEKTQDEKAGGEETSDEKPANVKTMGSWKIENFEEKFNDLQKANTPVQVLTATAEFLKCIMVEKSLQSSADASEETVQKGNEEETQNQDSQNKNDSENQ